jgi:hypothetical protein
VLTLTGAVARRCLSRQHCQIGIIQSPEQQQPAAEATPTQHPPDCFSSEQYEQVSAAAAVADDSGLGVGDNTEKVATESEYYSSVEANPDHSCSELQRMEAGDISSARGIELQSYYSAVNSTDGEAQCISEDQQLHSATVAVDTPAAKTTTEKSSIATISPAAGSADGGAESLFSAMYYGVFFGYESDVLVQLLELLRKRFIVAMRDWKGFLFQIVFPAIQILLVGSVNIVELLLLLQ